MMAMPDYSLSDIAAASGNGNGFGNGDSAWWLLVLFALLGGFGNNRGFGNGGGQAGGNELYPWINQSENVNQGFRDQMLQTGIQGVQQGINGLSTQLCNCCGDMQMTVANGFNGVNVGMLQGFNGVNVGMLQGFNGIEQGANTRQMANMQTQFGLQNAVQQGFTGVQAQTAQLASDIQLGNAQQTATILAENCADRAALSDGVRDIIASNTAQTQAIIDKLCQLELDGYKRQVADEQRANADLRSQLTQARFDASQQAQNAFIQNGFANEVDALYNRLNNCPVPTTPVYGRTPIFTCNQNPNCPCMGN